MADDFQLMQQEITDLKRRMGNLLKIGTVTDVQAKDGERKVRIAIDKDDEGKPIPGPWQPTSNGRSEAREETRYTKGQNVMMICPNGEFTQAHVMPAAENNRHGRPDHADDKGESETYQYDQLRMTKQKDTYEVWLAEESTEKKDDQQQQGASGQGGAQQDQGHQKQKRNGPGTPAAKVRVHKDGGITGRVGKDDNAVRFSAHKDGAKIKFGKQRWVTVTKNNIVFSEPPILGKDPIPDDNA
jgi:hypothetical protein